jgi:hypothetical protein
MSACCLCVTNMGPGLAYCGHSVNNSGRKEWAWRRMQVQGGQGWFLTDSGEPVPTPDSVPPGAYCMMSLVLSDPFLFSKLTFSAYFAGIVDVHTCTSLSI